MSADLQFFFEAKAAGEFKHVDAQKVRRMNDELGAGDLVILICGDCKHSRDQIGRLFTTFQSMDPHLLALNGGPLKADGICNVKNAGYAQDEILEALEAKLDREDERAQARELKAMEEEERLEREEQEAAEAEEEERK